MYLSASRAFMGGVGRAGGGGLYEGASDRAVFAVATVDGAGVVLVVDAGVEITWLRVGEAFEGGVVRREAICVFGCVVVRAFVFALGVVVLLDRVGLDALALLACVEGVVRVVVVRTSRRPS